MMSFYFRKGIGPDNLSKKMMVMKFLAFLLWWMTVSGCVGHPVQSAQVSAISIPSITAKSEGLQITTPVMSQPPHLESTETNRPQTTSTPIRVDNSTRDEKWHNPGDVIAPIFLYHHVSDQEKINRYAVSVSQFRQQMDLLDHLGYKTITIAQLETAISDGAYLPEKPMIITFDDGAEDIFSTAYPIMKAHGYSGTLYIVGNYLDANEYLSVGEIKEMHEMGWEIGSHSMTHANLNQTPSLSNEIFKSRKVISERTGIAINSFAYPFGIYNDFLAKKVITYGYKTAVGLGWSYNHSPDSIYYLSRIEIKHTLPLYDFNAKLPWKMTSDRFIELYPD